MGKRSFCMRNILLDPFPFVRLHSPPHAVKPSILLLIFLSLIWHPTLMPSQTSEDHPNYFGSSQPNSSATQNTVTNRAGSANSSIPRSNPISQTPVVASPADIRFYAALAVASQGTNLGKTATVGGSGGFEFSDVYPYGGLLVGFDVWTGSGTVITWFLASRPSSKRQREEFEASSAGVATAFQQPLRPNPVLRLRASTPKATGGWMASKWCSCVSTKWETIWTRLVPTVANGWVDMKATGSNICLRTRKSLSGWWVAVADRLIGWGCSIRSDGSIPPSRCWINGRYSM